MKVRQREAGAPGFCIGAREAQGTCPVCGERYAARAINQAYCSEKCKGRASRKRQKAGREAREAEMARRYPSVSFQCSQCGKMVVTEAGAGDMGTRFCSAECERKFWKHPHWENPSTNMNFRSLKEYMSYERRANGE